MQEERSSERLNKDILAKEISVEFGMSISKSRKIIDKTFSRIKEVVVDGGKVSIYDFGTFEKKDRNERLRYIPSLDGKVQIKSSSYPKFNPSKSFKSDLIKNKNGGAAL